MKAFVFWLIPLSARPGICVLCLDAAAALFLLAIEPRSAFTINTAKP